jgi:hypothetical protein
MTVVRVAALAACLVLAALAGRVEPAYACSCAPLDPRSALAASDGAFVGTYLERRERGGGRADYVFRVEQALKGALGGTAVVESADNGAACGLEVEVGQRIGLVLDRVGGTWTSNLCRQIEPNALLAAARPLPPPNGSGPAALLVGGRFGSVRTIALDARGRTLGYGRGRGETILLAACPGSQRVVEYSAVRPSFLLAVRDLRTYRLVRERRYRPRGSALVGAIACLDRSGTSIAVFESNEVERHAARLRVGARTVWAGRAQAAAFGRGVAYLAAGSTLLRIELPTGRVTRRVRVPGQLTALAASPSGVVAGLAPSRLVRVDATGRVRSARLPTNAGGELAWWKGRTVFLPRWSEASALVYDGRLRPAGRIAPWTAADSAVAGGRAYGVMQGTLFAATLPSGTARAVRRLPGPLTHLLAPA